MYCEVITKYGQHSKIYTCILKKTGFEGDCHANARNDTSGGSLSEDVAAII